MRQNRPLEFPSERKNPNPEHLKYRLGLINPNPAETKPSRDGLIEG
jgi:hypothetical protein